MVDEIKRRIHILHDLYVTGINQIAEWNKFIPSMQQTEENLRWIESSLNQSPFAISETTDEMLLDYLDKAIQGVAVFGSIPKPTLILHPVVNTSGSIIPSVYNQYVSRIETQLSNQPEVVEWAKNTIATGNSLREKQNRSDKVRKRLTQLRQDLGDLYGQAVNASLAAKANIKVSIEAAAILDRVIERFKGELIDRCRRGDKANYKRISDNLAANSELTRTAVEDGQTTYDQINIELMRIRKSMQPSSGERIMELLYLIEDHIIIITDALDPDKLGISFI